jgi:hypothetical protein
MVIFAVGMEGLFGMKETGSKVLLDIRVILMQMGIKSYPGAEAPKSETVKAG